MYILGKSTDTEPLGQWWHR